MTDTPSPLTAVDPDSITSLFDKDPDILPPVDLDRLIAELRQRAATAQAAAAAAEAAPKAAKRARPTATVDPAIAAKRDIPASQLNLDDIL